MADISRHSELTQFIIKLKKYRHCLTRQQIKTIRGQAINGDIDGAELGLYNILIKKREKNG